MTKTINKYGQEVDDYQTALEWAKNAPWKDIKCKNCEDENEKT